MELDSIFGRHHFADDTKLYSRDIGNTFVIALGSVAPYNAQAIEPLLTWTLFLPALCMLFTVLIKCITADSQLGSLNELNKLQ